MLKKLSDELQRRRAPPARAATTRIAAELVEPRSPESPRTAFGLDSDTVGSGQGYMPQMVAQQSPTSYVTLNLDGEDEIHKQVFDAEQSGQTIKILI